MSAHLLNWSPGGAAPRGSALTLSLRPRRAEGFSHARVTLTFEQWGGAVREYDLPWTGMEGAEDVFSAEVTLPEDYVGLVWCSCTLTGFLGRRREESGRQLTVYDPSFPVPEWFGEGVTYQIFPDRFRRTRVPDPAGMVGGRTVHRNWDEAMEWRPDEKGEVRNRDFFGGDLKGIGEKLPYLRSLGVDTLYLCPIFEGAENHRYGTGDYEKIDPMLGTAEDFSALCRSAHALGMRVVLDGVFNHVGYESRYFGGGGSYPDSPGAARVQDGPYADWFSFSHWPDRYDCWWGIYSLPAVNEASESYRSYIFASENSIVRRWLRAGADGWRLDVADELPDDFISALRAAVRREDPEAVVLGEVWEDGTNKMAYGVRRAHLWGGHLDGLMNYPFRTALLQALEREDFAPFGEAMEVQREHYPPFALRSAMNFLGTHDTCRIVTQLGSFFTPIPPDKADRAEFRLPEEARRRAEELWMAAAAVLYAFPGSPTLYYGDELGLEGCEDPFNRAPFPWDAPRGGVWQWLADLGRLRGERESLKKGDLTFLLCDGPLLCFARTYGAEGTLCAVNLSAGERELPLPDGVWAGEALVGPGKPCDAGLLLPGRSAGWFPLLPRETE